MELHLITHLRSLQALVQWATTSENCPLEAQGALAFLATFQLDLDAFRYV